MLRARRYWLRSCLRTFPLMLVWWIAADLAAPSRSDAQAPPTSGAQASSEAATEHEDAQYRELIESALRELSLGNYQEARALMERAHAVNPSARTLRGLANVEFQLRDYPACVRDAEAALASEVLPLTEELRGEVEGTLKRAYMFVARMTITLKPLDAQVEVDGQATKILADQPLLLSIGTHTLTARAPGHSEAKRTLAVRGGEIEMLSIELKPVEKEAKQKPVEKEAKQARPHWYQSPWLWAGVGVVVAGAAAGAGVALARDESPKAYGGTANALLTAP